MKTGFRGAFVISWSQTIVDGLRAAPLESVAAGATWRWTGEALRVDGPMDVLRLERTQQETDIRRHAARAVRKLIGAALAPDREGRRTTLSEDEPLLDDHFSVTDGLTSHAVSVIETGRGSHPLLMFLDDLPPRDRDLWVVRTAIGQRRGAPQTDPAGVICFTPGTMIATPQGERAIETLREGDHVSTLDSGAQEIVWMGSRRMTGARLFAMPALRPIRFAAGALGTARPRRDLVVSPEHRLLLRGPSARALFNTPEVLVRAADLVNGGSVRCDPAQREVFYIHLMLESHQIVRANGVETESFHPAAAPLSALAPRDRDRLLTLRPDLARDPYLYGPTARRGLSAPEAAIMLHEAA